MTIRTSFAGLTLVALAACIPACSTPAPTEDFGAVAQTADHRPIFLTTKGRRATGAVIHHDGYDSQIRLSTSRESVDVMSNEAVPQIIRRDWVLSHTEFQERGKTVFSYLIGYEPRSRIYVLRGFSEGRELTCVMDFAHVTATGHGLMSRDVRVGGKSVRFDWAEWRKDAPPPMACDLGAAFPVTARLMTEWAPLFTTKWSAPGISYVPVTPGLTNAYDAGGGTGSVTPQDFPWSDGLSDDDRLNLEIAFTMGVIGAVGGAKLGTVQPPHGMVIGAIMGFAIGFSGTFLVESLKDEKKRLQEIRKEREKAGKTGRRDDRGTGDERGRYVEPRPSDVGWNGQTGGQERGGDEQGMNAGDIPSNSGGGQGTRGYPGGSGPHGPGGGPGGDCTEDPTDDTGRVAVANLRPMMWCE